MSVVVGALVALAVAVACARAPETGAPTRGSAVDRRAPPVPRPGDLSAVLRAAAAQLRSGAPPAQAWSRALAVPGAVPVPDAHVLLSATRGRRSRRARAPSPSELGRARAVVAAARVSEELGAPLAGVLERIAAAVAADEEVEGERLAALAGPRATAQVLAWLPLLGVLLGTALGADPVRVVLDGGLGSGAAALGLLLVLAGRRWTAALVTRAARS